MDAGAPAQNAALIGKTHSALPHPARPHAGTASSPPTERVHIIYEFKNRRAAAAVIPAP
jgi:hypothetical protein